MPEFGLAGAEIMAENLTYELIKQGLDVKVVSLYNYYSAITDRLERNNIKIYYLNKKSGLDFSQIFRLYKVFKAEKPDVVHTHRYVMEYVIPAAVMARVPVRIHTVHNIAKKENCMIHRKLNKLFYKLCDVIPVSLSPVVQTTVMEEYKLKSEDTPVVYNGIDLENCIPKRGYESNTKTFTYLHIGRFAQAKNHSGLLEAFKIVHEKRSNTRLVLIGDGDLVDNIREKVFELGLNNCVIFLGSQDSVYNYLYDADVFVLPSLYEGMPMTLIEAMATGLPIVTTNVGGIQDMIENGVNGLITSVDKDAIAAALLCLEEDEELRRKLGNAAIIASKNFSSTIMAKKYISIYNNYFSTICGE